MEDETTIKILEIIKDIKERQESAENRQHQFSEMMSSLEAKINETAAAAGGAGFVKDSDGIRKHREELSNMKKAMDDMLEKIKDAERIFERHINSSREECKRETESSELRTSERIKEAEERFQEIAKDIGNLQSEEMKKMQNLRADENELKKVSERTDFIERRTGLEKRNMELKVKDILEKNDERAAMLEEGLKNLEKKIMGIEKQLKRLDGMEKSVEATEGKLVKMTGEIRSQQEKFLKDILKGLG